MEFEKYFEEVNPQKQIDKLAKKYKNKRILFYGAGKFFKEIYNNYDLSKLNIVGISDRSFNSPKAENCTNYKAYKPEELKDVEFDILALSVLEPQVLVFSLREQLDSINKADVKLIPFIKPKKSKIFKIILDAFFK